MKRLFYSVIFATPLFCCFGYASLAKYSTISGLVASFNENTVKLYVRGQFVTVPKSSIPKEFKVRVGNEVTAFIEIKREIASKKNK